QDQKFTGLLQQIELERRTKKAGWFPVAWKLVQEAAAIRKDVQLRSQAAACLIGLDARQRMEEKSAASSVAFDPGGRYLLVGGAPIQSGKPAKGARLWDSTTKQWLESPSAGPGPVAFGHDGVPYQLVVRDGSALALLNVREKQVAGVFAFDFKPENFAPNQ